jgi:flagellar assembly protein FliH
MHARLDALLARIDEEDARARAAFDDALADLEPALLRLALAIAAKVVRREVAAGGFDLAGGVREALSKVTRGLGLAPGDGERRIRIRAAPDDASLLRAALADHPAGAARLAIEEDPALRPGGCLVDCDLRRVVVDAEHELERVREALVSDGGGGANG